MKKFDKSTNQKIMLWVIKIPSKGNFFSSDLKKMTSNFQWVNDIVKLQNFWQNCALRKWRGCEQHAISCYVSSSIFENSHCLWCSTHRAIVVPWYEASEQIPHNLKVLKPLSFLAGMSDVIHITLLSMSTKRKFRYTE